MPVNFATQSIDVTHHQLVNCGGGQALWLQPPQPNGPVRLRLDGLLPRRFYRILPGRRLFARTDRHGRLRALLRLERATLITIEPVV